MDVMHSRWARWAWVAVPVLMLLWVGLRNGDEDRAALEARYRTIAGETSPAEEAAASALLREAYGILRSPEFEQNLRSLEARYPQVYASRQDPAADVPRVAGLVSLKAPGSRYAPLDMIIVGSAAREDPEREHASAGGQARYSDMSIGRGILAMYGSANPAERSCAINVAAHEYAHTISTTPFLFVNAFTDTRGGQTRVPNRRNRESPIGSYLIGAVAQCTWLQENGHLGGGLDACVELFGARAFNWDRCKAFAPTETVRPKPGLPPASPPL